MALLQLLPSSSSSALTHKSSVNPLPTSSLNPYSSSNKLDRFCTYKSLISPCRIPSLRCSASSFSEKHHHIGFPKSDEFVELPLFPFPLILFPGSILALQIFEFQHRIMMHTLLQTDLRFGVLYRNFNYGTADVGCVGEVIKHERLHDDRFYIICKGQERFRVSTIVRNRPYLVGKVSWMEDRPLPDDNNNLKTLANDVETYMKNVIRYSN